MNKNRNSRTLIGSTCSLFVLAALTFMIVLGMSISTEAQVIKLKYGTYGPRSVLDEPALWYIDEVSKRSGVKIEVETYFAGILAKPADCLDALGVGVYQYGWISSAFTPAKTPLGMILNGTPLVGPSLTCACKAADELVRSFPPAAAEFEKANVKFLFHTGVGPYDLISTKPVKSLEDLKGLRTRAFGYLSKVWSDLGGTPVMLSVAEAYDALQKGTLDAVLMTPFNFHKGLRLYEVAKHMTKFDLAYLPTPVLMNMATFNKLPEKVQKEMLDLAKEMPAHVEQIISKLELQAIEDMKKEGVSVYELSASDKAKVREGAKTIAKTVVDDLASKGVGSAKETMDLYLAGIEKCPK